MSLLWITLILTTLVRLIVSSLGHYSMMEAYLMLCAQHLDWGYVEGPAGLPALIKIGTLLFGNNSFALRLFSPLMMLVASGVLWRIALSLFPNDKRAAIWSVIAFNLLPLTNAASVVMEGTMITGSWWIIAAGASWNLVSKSKEHFSIKDWIFLGLILALGTQFSYAIGWLLPTVVLIKFLTHDFSSKTAIGTGASFILLILGWIAPLWWNWHHDMIQWIDITWGTFWSWEIPSLDQLSAIPLFCLMPIELACLALGLSPFLKKDQHPKELVCFLLIVLIPFLFYVGAIGHHHTGLGLLLAWTTLLLPGTVVYFLKNSATQKFGLGLILAALLFSTLSMIGVIPRSSMTDGSIPSWTGVTGVQKVAIELLRLRTLHPDASGHLPFIIAEQPGLAALLGTSLPITYPELPEAPAVFVPESPDLASQFSFWPSYADALITKQVDPLYTDQQAVSPFLTRDALYITTESEANLPETIRRSFAEVLLLGESSLLNAQHREVLNIYLCHNYQMMSL